MIHAVKGLSVVHEAKVDAFWELLDFSAGFPHSPIGKESPCNVGELGSIPESGRSPGEGNGNPLSILVWSIPWTEEPGRLQSMGSQESDMTEWLWLHLISLWSNEYWYFDLWFVCLFENCFVYLEVLSSPTAEALLEDFENYIWVSLVAQLVKNPPAVRETWVLSMGWEDPLEKGKATHSSILAWKFPWTVRVQRVTHDRASNFHFCFHVK